MSQISLKSISGITSITTPTGVDNQFTLHTNNTNEALKLDGAGNLHFHNHLNITGISTASNFKTGTSNLHNTGLNVQDLDVDGHTNLDNVSIAGVTTASSGVNISGGNLQMGGTNVLNSGRALYNLEQIKLGDSKELVLGTGNDLKIYHSGVHSFISEEGNGALKFKGDDIRFEDAGGTEALRIDSNGAVMIRTTTAGAHSSDLTIGGTTGAGRIMIRSANNGGGYINFQDTTGSTVDGSIEYNHILNSFNFYFESQERFRIHTQGMLGLSGANYGTSGQVLTSGGTGSPVSWTTVSGTTINNNADNRIITGSGTANTLEGEAGLTYNGSMLNVNSVTSENNAFRIYNTTDNSVRYQINGEGNSFIGHTYPRADASIDLGFHTGYRWRDVVLSGGIRFGSSSADDYLDDYEEGTFTPTINVGSYTTFLTNRYIKIGRLVHLHGGLIFNNNSSGTRVEISNIPFAQQSGGQYVGNVWLRRTSTGERNWNMILGEAGTNVLGIFRDSNGGHSDMGGHLSYSDFGSSATYFNYSITYISAS